MSNQPDYSDRRRHARFELLDYAIIAKPDVEESVRSVVVDISLGGLQIRSRYQFQQGEAFKMTIGRGNNQPVTINAEVRYSTPIEDSDLFSTGFRFVPQTAVERIEWVEYVHGVFKLQGEMLVN
ncbi:MAG: PilZ domain-containing protein [Fimbriimonadaceae bacterium]|jgi:c-di-GMP-binding flagellar brake protein YcgR|nr:PilZ domain-containing protein [Fimbriimonadaceae bacterium]